MANEIEAAKGVPKASDVLLPKINNKVDRWISRMAKTLNPLTSANEANFFGLERQERSLEKARMPYCGVIYHDKNVSFDV